MPKIILLAVIFAGETMRMEQSALFLFLGKCLAMDDDSFAEEQVRQKLPSVPVRELLAMAIRHSMLPALWPMLSRHDLLTLLPSGIQEMLEQTHVHNLEKNNKILEQVSGIAVAFKSRGLHPVFLKGAGYLLQGLYPDPGERVMTDIDMLVREEEEESAVSLLRELGYDHQKINQEGDYGDHRHLPPLVHPVGEVPVELHRMALHGDYGALLPAAELHGHSQEAGESGARVLSVLHQQILHVFHEMHHTRGTLDSLGTLRGMYDFYLLWKRRNPGPEDVAHSGHRRRYLRYIATVGHILDTSQNKTISIAPGAPRNHFPISYLGWQLFLMNHPWLNSLYFQGFYRPLYLAGLTLKSPFRSPSRRLLAKKWKKFNLKRPLSG